MNEPLAWVGGISVLGGFTTLFTDSRGWGIVLIALGTIMLIESLRFEKRP